MSINKLEYKMPKHHVDYQLIDEEKNNTPIQTNRYKVCCINKNVFAILITILCIVFLISTLTFINIYAIQGKDGSL